MHEVDIHRLGTKERKAFLLSFQPALGQRGTRNLVLAALIALAAVTLFAVYGIERTPLAAMAILLLLVLLLEKVSYSLEIRVYRSLVRDLALRIEQQPVTGLHPSEELPPKSSDPVAV